MTNKEACPDLTLERLAVVRQRIRVQQQYERQNRWVWSIYDSPLASYLDAFDLLAQEVPQGGIRPYLRYLSRKKAKLAALDVAGQGHGLLELKDVGVASVTAITLVDKRNVLQRFLDTWRGLTLIEGDVTLGSTWSQVSGQFDFIICRPAGGLMFFNYPEISLAVFAKMYQRLADNGLLVTEVPASLDDVLSKSMNVLSRVFGLRVGYIKYGGFFLIREARAPANLRFLKPNAERIFSRQQFGA